MQRDTSRLSRILYNYLMLFLNLYPIRLLAVEIRNLNQAVGKEYIANNLSGQSSNSKINKPIITLAYYG